MGLHDGFLVGFIWRPACTDRFVARCLCVVLYANCIGCFLTTLFVKRNDAIFIHNPDEPCRISSAIFSASAYTTDCG
jgi:hypothetical protein